MPPGTFEELVEMLRNRFANTSRQEESIAKLLYISQGAQETVHAYALRFEQLLDQVDTFDEAWLQRVFI